MSSLMRGLGSVLALACLGQAQATPITWVFELGYSEESQYAFPLETGSLTVTFDASEPRTGFPIIQPTYVEQQYVVTDFSLVVDGLNFGPAVDPVPGILGAVSQFQSIANPANQVQGLQMDLAVEGQGDTRIFMSLIANLSEDPALYPYFGYTGVAEPIGDVPLPGSPDSYGLNQFVLTQRSDPGSPYQAIKQGSVTDWRAQPIPEPGTLALIGVGVAGLVWSRRRANARQAGPVG